MILILGTQYSFLRDSQVGCRISDAYGEDRTRGVLMLLTDSVIAGQSTTAKK